MLKLWKTLESTIVFNNPWYVLRQDKVELPDGKIVDDYFVSVRQDVALIFPLTDKGEVVMVRQYKHGLGEIVTELPGGFFDKETETAESAARRELLEETGYVSGDLTKLITLADNPTKDTNRLHVFLAQNCVNVQEQNLDATEDIEVIAVQAEQVQDMIHSGAIKVSGSVAAILLGLEKIGKL